MEPLLIFTFTFSALSLGILSWIAYRIHALEGNILEDIDALLAQAVLVIDSRIREILKETLEGGIDLPEFNPVQNAIVEYIQNLKPSIDVTPRDGAGRFARGADGEKLEP